MPKLLHIQSSPRGARSASTAVAAHFIDAYAANNPDTQVETLNLWQAELPEFNGDTIDAKYAVLAGEQQTAEQEKAWKAVGKVVDHFKSADTVLFSVPMWNFGIPYKLKHYFDVLVQPGLTIKFVPGEGMKGLVTDKTAIAIYARGGAYDSESGFADFDKQSPHLRQMLEFIGFKDIHEIFLDSAAGSGKDDAVTQGKLGATVLAKALR